MDLNKALIVVYFGDIGRPVLTSLETLLKNELDVYLFSDNSVDIDSNKLFQFKIEKDDFNKLSSKTLGFNPNLESAYKLCDFKYFYPNIFKEYLAKDYAYIGFCDVDVLYGDIDKYICQSVLKGSDVIGSRGHFMLFNEVAIKIIDEFFLSKKKGYTFTKNILISNYHFAFDEFNFLHKVLDRLNQKGILIWDEFFSLNAVDICYFKRMIFCVNRNVILNQIIFNDNLMKISYDDIVEEVPYIHYQKRPFPLALDSVSLSDANHDFSFFSMLISRLKYKIKDGPFLYVWLKKQQFIFLVDKYL